jgi:hypothetical protein
LIILLTSFYFFIGVRECFAFHVAVVDERSQNRLYSRTSPLGKETCVIGIATQFFVHLIVQRFVDAVIQFLEPGDLSAAFRP